ncbi:Beta-lactamase [Spirosomataceae bacterium TFI 002]|nr:Beta-lactamase [Spirosomataceae bacterium TFI 002]
MNSKIKSILRIAFILVSIGSLYFVPWVIVKAWITPLPETVQEQLDDSITFGFDGMIVYVDQAGKPPEFYAAGYKNRAEKTPADPKSLFKIGSINKLYVAVAITKLVNSNRLSLDKTLADYFPELADRIEYSDEITLRLMVQHRSGLPIFTNHPGFWDKPQGDSIDVLEYALDLPANFKPGEDYEYCNTGYLLLARLIDKVVGYSHFQFIKEEILNPLGLKNTYGSLSEVNIDDLMSGYYVGYEEDIKANDYGSMIASAEDVGIFLRALNDGSVFKEGEQEIYSSIYEYEHGGLIPGYQCLAEYHKDIDTVVVQFMNTTDFNGYNWNLSQIFINRIVKILKRQKS